MLSLFQLNLIQLSLNSLVIPFDIHRFLKTSSNLNYINGFFK